MKKNIVEIDREVCKGCLLCVDECKQKVLSVSAESNRHGYYPVQPTGMDKCTGCTLCAIVCPDAAITVMRVEE